jgi:preprotein translocase subunit SecE
MTRTVWIVVAVLAATLVAVSVYFKWPQRAASWTVDSWRRARAFFADVRAEMKKVSFPGRDEVVGTTIVVLVTSVVFAVFLWAADMLIIKGYQAILKVVG